MKLTVWHQSSWDNSYSRFIKETHGFANNLQIFHVRELFSRFVGPVIDKVLGLRCASYGYQYIEIVGSLSSVYFCGGDCVEDVTSHLMPHLSLHPTLRTCSSDTILRGISELAIREK